MVAKIATGEVTETIVVPTGKVRSGEAGGRARADKLTPEDRKKIAAKAARARWQ